MRTPPSDKDQLLLSMYLVGALSSQQAAILESRLASEKDLLEVFNQLKRTRAMVASLPTRQVPHNFTIKSGDLPRKQPVRLFPVFRLATAICSLLFAITLGMRGFTTRMMSPQNVAITMADEVQEYAMGENPMWEAAPKASEPIDTAPSDAYPAQETTPMPAGAGALTAPQPELDRSEEEVITEEIFFPGDSYIPWVPIIWSLGLISVLLGIAMLYFYNRERV
jgi:hypothetical protein